MNKERMASAFGLPRLLAEVRLLDIQWKKAVAFGGDGGALPLGCLELLKALASGGEQTVPQLAHSQSTSRQNIQVLVNRLKRGGQLEVQDNPAHKRSVLVGLTEAGRAAVASAVSAERRLLDDLSSRLGEVKIEDALQTLQGIRSSLNDPAAQDTRPGSIKGPRFGKSRGAPAVKKPEAAGLPDGPAGQLVATPEPVEYENGELPFNLL